jgi:hypothetical protein
VWLGYKGGKGSIVQYFEPRVQKASGWVYDAWLVVLCGYDEMGIYDLGWTWGRTRVGGLPG